MAYIVRTYRLTLTGLYWIWRRTQNLVGWVGLLVAVFTLYQQIAGKEHNLNIIVSSIDPGGDEITFGMIYQNTGNYTEIITDADASLRDNKSPTVSWGDTLEDCFAPIVLRPGDAIHKYYTVKLPYYGFEKTPDKNGNLESDLILSYSVLMPNAGSERFTLNIGEVKHRAVEGTFADLRIKKNILKVEFEDARIGASSQSIPNRSTSTVCAKKRRNVVN
jgi:hypothetical protein